MWFKWAVKYNKLLREHVALQKESVKLYKEYRKLQDEHIDLLGEFIDFRKRYERLIEISGKLINSEEKIK